LFYNIAIVRQESCQTVLGAGAALSLPCQGFAQNQGYSCGFVGALSIFFFCRGSCVVYMQRFDKAIPIISSCSTRFALTFCCWVCDACMKLLLMDLI